VLTKLIDLNVRPASIIQWIAEFLTSRQQCVRYHSTCSDWLALSTGVPQGTKLGPILFLVMINDAKPAAQNTSISVFKYVDDMSIVECRKVSECSELQSSLDTLVDWCGSNKMKLNPSKCFQMNVNFSRNPVSYLPLFIEGHKLLTTHEMKVLGVTIQDDLKWDKNVDNILKRSNSKIHMLQVLKRCGLPYPDLVTIYMYTSFISPITEYVVPVWNAALTKCQSYLLERIQRESVENNTWVGIYIL
jgi:hypothetical protein